MMENNKEILFLSMEEWEELSRESTNKKVLEDSPKALWSHLVQTLAAECYFLHCKWSNS